MVSLMSSIDDISTLELSIAKLLIQGVVLESKIFRSLRQ